MDKLYAIRKIPPFLQRTFLPIGKNEAYNQDVVRVFIIEAKRERACERFSFLTPFDQLYSLQCFPKAYQHLPVRRPCLSFR